MMYLENALFKLVLELKMKRQRDRKAKKLRNVEEEM